MHGQQNIKNKHSFQVNIHTSGPTQQSDEARGVQNRTLPAEGRKLQRNVKRGSIDGTYFYGFSLVKEFFLAQYKTIRLKPITFLTLNYTGNCNHAIASRPRSNSLPLCSLTLQATGKCVRGRGVREKFYFQCLPSRSV